MYQVQGQNHGLAVHLLEAEAPTPLPRRASPGGPEGTPGGRRGDEPLSKEQGRTQLTDQLQNTEVYKTQELLLLFFKKPVSDVPSSEENRMKGQNLDF